jgi:hypothetical protein
LETILNELDKNLQSTFKNVGLKAYGFCELITKDNRTLPVTCDKDHTPAVINDRFKGIFYHRLTANIPITEDEEMSFGNLKLKYQPRIRTVMGFDHRLGEDFIFQFIEAIPDSLTISGYKFVILRPGTLIADHEAVISQEYGQLSNEKHRTSWNIYALEYDIDFMLC